MDNRISQMDMGLRVEIEETNRRITRVSTLIENDITKLLDALVDGYKGNYGRQEELAQKVDVHDRRIDRLDTIAVWKNACI